MRSPASRRSFLKKIAVVPALPGALPDVTGRRTAPSSDLDAMKKIDVHTHLSSDALYLREVMDELSVKMFTICNEGLKVERLEAQIRAAIDITKAYPRYYARATTFGFDDMYAPDWADRVNATLGEHFDQGALAVKVWKEIGMEVLDPSGRFVQIDDPIFDPILDYIARQDRTLLAHIADPVQRWLSFGDDWQYDSWYTEGKTVIRNRVGRFQGEVSYDRMIRARDRMIAKHPDLRIIGFHLGSMEFDVAEVAKRLDEFPNFAVSTGGTLRHLMKQSREAVSDFFIRYQDRIMYASDVSGGMVPTQYLIDMSKVGQKWTPEELEREKERLLARYRREFSYYATDDEFDLGNYSVRGLALPDDVLRKVFYDNAAAWLPGITEAY